MLFRHSPRPRHSPPMRRWRPSLEALEDRTALSTIAGPSPAPDPPPAAIARAESAPVPLAALLPLARPVVSAPAPAAAVLRQVVAPAAPDVVAPRRVTVFAPISSGTSATGVIYGTARGEAGPGRQFVYLDLNQNGSWERGEPATVTDTRGGYSFTGLELRTYTVRYGLHKDLTEGRRVTLTAGRAQAIELTVQRPRALRFSEDSEERQAPVPMPEEEGNDALAWHGEATAWVGESLPDPVFEPSAAGAAGWTVPAFLAAAVAAYRPKRDKRPEQR